MASRESLSKELHEIVVNEGNHVYFQPPEGYHIDYPCIIYKLNRPDIKYAENNSYVFMQSYNVTYITTDPDSDIVKRMLSSFIRISPDQPYIYDNLYHYSFTLYY